MLTINGIDSYKANYQTSFNNNNHKIQHKKTKVPPLKTRKIGINEGADLLLKGFVKQGIEMVTSVIEHPLKAVGIIGGTTLGLMTLPLIGVPTAVGGGALAVVFTGIATAKTIYHTALFAKNNHEGSYDLARIELQQIGESTFDLALSAPFAPKALTKIRNFKKYGEFGMNSKLINDIKSTKGIINKAKKYINHDNELLRKMNFSDAVDKELLKLNNITDAEKAQIKKELLAFNIPEEKIPYVVLDKWSEITGVKTQPDFSYASLPQNTNGCAYPGTCSIQLNDYRKQYASTFADYIQLNSTSVGDNYMITYLEKSTGRKITEQISKSILDAYNNLCKQYKTLTHQSKNILVMVHEREHINQYAKIFSLKGFDLIKTSITQRSKTLYNNMISEMPKIEYCSPEAMEIESFITETTNSKTPIAYIKKPIEIGARKVEAKAANHPIFKKLNNVFARVNKNAKIPIENEIIMNEIRVESAIS